jgi:circadian clock protein KaiB
MKIRTINEMEIGHQKFRLYISNRTARSLLALANLNKMCDEYFKGECDIEVVDLQQNPQLAKKGQILSIPTLERISPKSEKRIIGDLSDTRRVLGALGLRLEM